MAASPAPARPSQQCSASIAGLHLTNTHLEASFHDRCPMDLAAWLIPASFRPPTTAFASHHHHLQSRRRNTNGNSTNSIHNHDDEGADPSAIYDQSEGTLRVAPKRLHPGMDHRAPPTARWIVDVVWLVVFAALVAAIVVAGRFLLSK